MTHRFRVWGLCLLISIHMPHTWHDVWRCDCGREIEISIHMPHTWHDPRALVQTQRTGYFNPHATYVA